MAKASGTVTWSGNFSIVGNLTVSGDITCDDITTTNDVTTGRYLVYDLATVQTQQYGSAAPTTGSWAVGDIVWNTGAAASGTVGWVCTNATGSGTWNTFGAISA